MKMLLESRLRRTTAKVLFRVLAVFAIVGLWWNSDPSSFASDRRYARSLRNYEPLDSRIVSMEERMDPKDIKYVAFGSSNTWGASLGERTKDAYPWLLSKNAMNLAIRASGPSYPSACTYSMMGEEHYDVIVLEFFLRAEDGVRNLALRLRERYPDAIIIFLVNWFPAMIGAKQSDGRTKNLMDWRTERGYGSIIDPKFHSDFRQSDETWEWRDGASITDPRRTGLIDDIAKEVGGVVSIMERPDNPRLWLPHATRFASDWFHLSELGHVEVKERVEKIVQKYGVPKNPQPGKFSYKDVCTNWFESGDTKDVEWSDNVKLAKMSNTAKFALDFPTDGSEGWVDIINPSSATQALYLSYMTTGPPPSKYPRAEVTTPDGVTIHLDPNSPSGFGDKAVHVLRMADIGDISPGKLRLKIRALEETERPFRLVSVIVTKRLESNEALQERGNQMIN